MAKLGQKKESAPIDIEALKAKLRGTLSHNNTLKNSMIALVGPVKQGKSVCAASISKHFPAELGTGELKVLEDTYWLGFDRAATDGFAELGFTVPGADLSVMPKDIYAFKANIAAAIKECKAYIEAGLVKNVVVDTVSSFDYIIMKYLADDYEGEKNKMSMWGDLKSSHLNLWHQISGLDARLVCIFHPKARTELISANSSFEDKEKAAAKKLSESLPDEAPLELDITGSSKKLWQAQASMILPVIREKKGKKPAEYYLHLSSAKGIQGCSRFNGGLESKQPANLGKLLEAIKANQPKL